MGYKKVLLIPLFGSMLAAGAAQVQAEASAVMMANTCAGCHGTEGKSVGPASPNLAGISEVYFLESMVGFQDGTRPATIMDRIAKGYTEAQIETMGTYFAGLPIYKAKQEVDAGKAKTGEEIYDKRCAKCHDENGALPDDDSGILAGQWLPYLKYSMADFQEGHREMPKKMKKQVKKLDADQIEAALIFFASQQ